MFGVAVQSLNLLCWIGHSRPAQFIDVQPWVHRPSSIKIYNDSQTPTPKPQENAYLLENANNCRIQFSSESINNTPLIYSITLLQHLFKQYFFHMKSNRVYNLALSPTCSQLSKNPALNQTTVLAHENIFAEEKSSKLNEHNQLMGSKNYEVVGLKELRSYQKRLKKTSRLNLGIDSLSTDRPVSKQSSENKRIKHDLLSKQQVIERLPQQIKEVQMRIRQRKPKRKRESWMTFSTQIINFEENSTFQVVKEEKKENQFSLTRLKKRIDEHKDQWAKNSNSNRLGNFPSLYKSVDLFRVKLEKKEDLEPDDNLVNTRSNLWGKTLRKSIMMANLCCKKQTTKTFHDEGSFLTKGNSKIDLQKKWLENKDTLGFKFKFCPEAIADDGKKSMVIR